MDEHAPITSREVEQIKEKLFGEERQKLTDLETYVNCHQNRIGTDEQLQNSVAKIIAGALREAEVTDYEGLSSAISPLVIKGIRQEIRNSRSEIANALYPHMGRLVSSYVSSNFYRFLQKTDQGIERTISPKHVRLGFKSFFRGIPYRQVLLEDAKFVQIRELLLINKESGLLIDHWKAYSDSDRSRHDPTMISSMLTAINQFSREALSDYGSELRTLDFGETCLYLRSTPMFLVAISCTGHANRQLEQKFDQELVYFLEQYAGFVTATGMNNHIKARNSLLVRFAERLNHLLLREAQAFETKRTSRTPVFSIIFLTTLFLSFSGWATNNYMQQRFEKQAREHVKKIVAKQYTFRGFPVEVKVSADKKTAHISGLAPTKKESERLVQEIKRDFPDFEVIPYLIPVFSEEQFQRTLTTGGLFPGFQPGKASGSSAGKEQSDQSTTGQQNSGGVTRGNEVKSDKSDNANPSQQLSLPTNNNNSGKGQTNSIDSQKGNQGKAGFDTPPGLTVLEVEETPDFNDPEVMKEMNKAQRLNVPPHLRSSIPGQGKGGRGNSGSGSTGNSSSSSSGNSNSQGASNSNKANAPGQLKKGR